MERKLWPRELTDSYPATNPFILLSTSSMRHAANSFRFPQRRLSEFPPCACSMLYFSLPLFGQFCRRSDGREQSGNYRPSNPDRVNAGGVRRQSKSRVKNETRNQPSPRRPRPSKYRVSTKGRLVGAATFYSVNVIMKVREK